jgi:hypothetical protein
MIGDQIDEFFKEDFSRIFFALNDKTKKESGGMCLPRFGTAFDMDAYPKTEAKKNRWWVLINLYIITDSD